MHIRILQAETRREEGGFKQQQDEISNRFLVRFVGIRFGFQGFDDEMIRVDFQVFLGCHVSHGAGVAECLCFHDPFHVGRPSMFTCHNTAWGCHQTV